MPTLGAYVVWGLGECQKEINDNKVLYWGAGAGAEPERGGVCVVLFDDCNSRGHVLARRGRADNPRKRPWKTMNDNK